MQSSGSAGQGTAAAAGVIGGASGAGATSGSAGKGGAGGAGGAGGNMAGSAGSSSAGSPAAGEGGATGGSGASNGGGGVSTEAGAAGDAGAGGDATNAGTGGAGGAADPGPAPQQTGYLKHPLLAESNEFGGYALDIDGDTLVVGSVESAQVFVDDGSGFHFLTELTGGGQEYAGFGNSVSVSGDTIVVGAYGESMGQGAAYVFVRDGAEFRPQATLSAGNSGAYFGVDVAIDGDLIAVGAPYQSSSPGGDPAVNDLEGSGGVYVFERSGEVWSELALLKAENADESDQLGSHVAISGNSILVGCPIEGSSATGVDGDGSNNDRMTSGAAYVFVRDGDAFRQQAYLKASHSDLNAFGSHLAIAGDLAAVGTEMESGSARGIDGPADATLNESGAVWLFRRNGDTWLPDAYVKASNTGADDHFSRVALEGNRLFVGAPGEASASRGPNGDQNDDAAPDAGAVYAFLYQGGSWQQTHYLKASNADAGDEFGSMVAVSGGRLVVGAGREASADEQNPSDNSQADAGAVYVFE